MSDLYDLPSGWEWKTIDDLCEILDRLRKPISQKNRVSGKFPYYGATGIVDYIDDYIFNEKLLLIGEDGAKWGANENTAFIANGKYWVNNHAHIMRPNREIVIDKILVYYLNTTDLMEYITGATVKKLNQQKLKSIKVPLPPISEQQRIVSKLDNLFEKIDKAIALHQKNIDEANVFMGSVLNDVFGELEEKYEKKQLKDLVSILGDGLHGTPKYDENGEYYFINGANIKNDKVVINENTKKVTFDEYEKYKKVLNNRTVLVSINGTIGNVGLYNNEKCMLGKSACYFNLLEDIDKVYITYVIKNGDFQKYIRNNATGATIKNVSLKTMRGYNMVLPPFDIQQKIVEYLDSISQKIEKVKLIQKEKMESLKDLKASILDKAFRGEL